MLQQRAMFKRMVCFQFWTRLNTTHQAIMYCDCVQPHSYTMNPSSELITHSLLHLLLVTCLQEEVSYCPYKQVGKWLFANGFLMVSKVYVQTAVAVSCTFPRICHVTSDDPSSQSCWHLKSLEAGVLHCRVSTLSGQLLMTHSYRQERRFDI